MDDSSKEKKAKGTKNYIIKTLTMKMIRIV